MNKIPNKKVISVIQGNKKAKLDGVVYDALSIISNNLEQDIWNYLRYWENEENLKEYYKINTGYKSNSVRLKHVSLCLNHARSYFEASKTANINIRPLIQFYGISCFAKAIVLFHAKGNPCKISSLQTGHGLQLDSNSVNNGLSQILVEVNSSGTFSQFNDVIKNQGYFEANCLGVGWKFLKYKSSNSSSILKKKICIKDLFACLPEIAMHYFLNYGERNNTFLLKKVTLDLDKRILSLNVVDFDMTSYTKVKNEILGHHFPSRPELHHLESQVSFDKACLPIYRALTGEQYLIGDIEKTTLNEMSVFYQLSFVLGMLVRYRPDVWDHIVSREGNLIYGFLDLCQTKVPLLALNVLTQNVFSFGLTTHSIFDIN